MEPRGASRVMVLDGYLPLGTDLSAGVLCRSEEAGRVFPVGLGRATADHAGVEVELEATSQRMYRITRLLVSGAGWDMVQLTLGVDMLLDAPIPSELFASGNMVQLDWPVWLPGVVMRARVRSRLLMRLDGEWYSGGARREVVHGMLSNVVDLDPMTVSLYENGVAIDERTGNVLRLR